LKIVILGDTHIGARNSNSTIEHWQRKFYNDFFWPTIDELGIKTIIQTGDYFDNRKWLNINSIATQKEIIINELQSRDINLHVFPGNHDLPLRHSLKNNSVQQILGHEKNVTVYNKPTKVQFDDREVTFMPWICKENYEECMEVLRAGGDIIVGHFEITGFVMHPGAISKEGISLEDFSGWNKVLSGHYHAQSKNANIQYVGTPYQMSWSDSTTKHGFWVLDLFTDEMRFFENPYRYFHRFVWEDGCDQPLENLEESFVKVSVKKKSDFEAFEKFIDKINFQKPFDMKVIESYENWSEENVKDLINISTTQDLIKEYVDDVATTDSAESIKKIMMNIFDEANNMEF